MADFRRNDLLVGTGRLFVFILTAKVISLLHESESHSFRSDIHTDLPTLTANIAVVHYKFIIFLCCMK